MTCDQIADRIIDHLYGELAEEERPAFEVHLSGCEGCRGKLAGLEQTRRSAQVALRGPLSQPAPERIRRAAMAAAELHVRQRAPSMKAAGVDARSVAGFWAWLRRPWFFPAFATVSLLALFFITRPMLMDAPRRALVSQLAEPSPAAEPGAPAEPAAAAPPAQSPPVVVAEKGDRGSGLERAGGTLDDSVRIQKIADLRTERVQRSGPPPVRQLAAPAKKMVAKRKAADFASAPELAAAEEAAKEEEAKAQPLGGVVATGARAEPEGASYVVESVRPSRATRNDSTPPAVRLKRAEPADRPPMRFAQPPPGPRALARPFASGAAMPPAPAPMPASAPPAAPPPAPAEAQERAAATRHREGPATARASASASADESDAPSAGAAGRGAASPPLSLQVLIEKADRHFSNQQWQAASDAYRELLRRFPQHERVAQWRQRLGIAIRALAR